MLIIWYIFSITKIAYVKILFVIVYIYKFVVYQIDVKITFLNDEEIYMELPKGLVIFG
jgi:uncharacterized metal-binding protein